MDKQTSLAFILIGIIFVVWFYFNSPKPTQLPQKKSQPTAVDQKDSMSNKPITEQLKEEVKQPEETPAFGQTAKDEKIITIETDLARIELTSKGAKIRRYFLKKFKTWYHNDIPASDTNFFNQHVQLVNTLKNGGDLDITFTTTKRDSVNTSNLDFKSNATNYYYQISGKDSLSINYTFSADSGKAIKKNFVFFGDNYASKIDIELDGMDNIIDNYKYFLFWSNGLNFVEGNSVDEANNSHASVFSSNDKFDFKAKSSGEKINLEKNGQVDWVSIKNKYFAMILTSLNPRSEDGFSIKGNHVTNSFGVREYYGTGLMMPFRNQKIKKDSFLLYLGPVDYYLLKTYNNNFQNLFEFGSLFGLKFIIRPISEFVMLPMLRFLHSFITNWGLVIILFSFIIKFALHPLTRQSLKSMRKMQMLQPKISELKEKFKDTPQKVQQETMKLYSTYGINPMGGCLPMLLQMPILVALWSLFNVVVDIRQQPFIFWIKNLSSPDIIVRLPFKLPLFGLDVISGLAVLMGITMFIQQKMTIQDPSQKAMIYIMPVMMTMMFMGLPSGLNLYYFMFNLLSIAQQYYVNHKHSDLELVPVANPKKKQGFMARLMESAEKQAQAQKQAANKKKK